MSASRARRICGHIGSTAAAQYRCSRSQRSPRSRRRAASPPSAAVRSGSGSGFGWCAAVRSRRIAPAGVRASAASSASKPGAKDPGRGVRKSGMAQCAATSDSSSPVSIPSRRRRAVLRQGSSSADSPGSRSTRRLSRVSLIGERANLVSARSSTPSRKLIIERQATSVGCGAPVAWTRPMAHADRRDGKRPAGRSPRRRGLVRSSALKGRGVGGAPSGEAGRRGRAAGDGPGRGEAPAAALGGGVSRRLVLLLAATCAVVVGNVYFPQALGPLVAAGLGVSAGSAALVATATQVGYAAGILLLVPLADRLPNRRLLVALLVCTGAGLFAAGCAPALGPLLAAGAFVGVSTVAGQVIAPMAVGLVPPERRGAMMGTLLSGSIGGMLLARTFGGALGELLGWRAPYLVAAVLALLLAVVLAVALPEAAPRRRGPWQAPPVQVLRLLRAEPELRRSCFYQ